MENFFDGMDDSTILRGLCLLMAAIINMDEKNESNS